MHKTLKSSLLEGHTDKNPSDPIVGTRLVNRVATDNGKSQGLGTENPPGNLSDLNRCSDEAGSGDSSYLSG